MYCLRLNESQSAEEHWLYFCAGAQLCASTLFVLYSPAALIFNEMYFIPLKMANKCSRPSVIGNRGAHCNFTVKAISLLMHHHHLLYPVWQQFYWSISLSTVFLLLGVQVSLYNVEYARQGKKPKEIYDPALLYACLGFILCSLIVLVYSLWTYQPSSKAPKDKSFAA